GVRLLAVGHPLENCGFAGPTVNGREWQALVKNYGRTPQRRTWWIEANGQKSPAQELSLAPGQSSALRGEFPAGANACELVLNADEFTLDDHLPLLVPQPKPLTITAENDAAFADFVAQFTSSIEAADSTALGKNDLNVAVYDPLSPRLPDATAIVFVADPAASKNFLPGNVVAEADPLSADLNWSGLLCRDTLRVPAKPGDQTLVWQGDRPLIFLRQTGANSLLVVNFDLRASNATRLPAFVLLLHLFVERGRAEKVAIESRNVETNQAIAIASDPSLPAPEIAGNPGSNLRAPSAPQFFEVKQGANTLLKAAAQFSDAREADFRDAATIDHVRDAAAQAIERNSQSDFLTPVWALALGAVMIGSWTWRQS